MEWKDIEVEYRGEKYFLARVLDAEYVSMVRDEPMGKVLIPELIEKYDKAPLEKKEETQKLFVLFKKNYPQQLGNKEEFLVTKNGVYKTNTPSLQMSELLDGLLTKVDEDTTLFLRLEQLYA
jgi:hypothetical protein